MNCFKWMAVMLCICLMFAGCARQEDNPWWTTEEPAPPPQQGSSTGGQSDDDVLVFKGPVLMTSFGQSADVLMLQKVFDVLSLPVVVDTLAPPEAIGNYATVIVVVGSSGKGLAAVALTQEGEQDRAAAFTEALEASNVSVMAAHIGGDLRLDDFTLELMALVRPVADAFLVIEGGDPHNTIRDYAEEQGKAYYAPGDILEAPPILRALFTGD